MIAPSSDLTYQQLSLLFCLEREMLVQDIAYCEAVLYSDNEYIKTKSEWLTAWEFKACHYLQRQLKTNDDKLHIKFLDKFALCEDIRRDRYAANQVFKECERFNPYNWQSLLELGNDDQTMKTIYKKLPDSHFDSDMRIVSLKLIEYQILNTSPF